MSQITSMGDQELPFFLVQNSGFRNAEEHDELLHPLSFENLQDDSATETQYFGFSVPEQNVHGLCYLWHHPNLHVVSGGVFVFCGVKLMTPQAELCDYRSYLSEAAIGNDLHCFRLDNGYAVRVLEPLKKLTVSYEDRARENSFDLLYEAVQPAVMFADGKHFEQTMRVRGHLTLRGRHLDVACYNVRDRSWGKPRPEKPLSIPPTSWMTGVFDEDFSFNCCVLDQLKHNPILSKELTVPHDKTLSSGWVNRNGKLGRIVAANKRVVRDRGLPVASRVDLDFDDHLGRHFAVRGSLVASCPFPSVVNKYSVINLIRWECDDLVGYGDCQESFLSDYLNLPNVL